MAQESFSFFLKTKSRNLNFDSTHEGSRSKPRTFDIFSIEIFMGSNSGRDFESTVSLISDAVQPHISRTSSVALSIA